MLDYRMLAEMLHEPYRIESLHEPIRCAFLCDRNGEQPVEIKKRNCSQKQ